MIIIRKMEERERDRVAAFVQRTMHKRYGSDAYALPELVFTAWRGEELLGAMALSTSNGEPFHLEQTYALDYRTFPAVFERAKIVQLGRWVAKVPNVAEALFYNAVVHALKKGYEWGIGEVKPQVARRFARMGIRVIVLSGEPILESIPPGALPYYLIPPPPVPAAIVLADVCAALRKKVRIPSS